MRTIGVPARSWRTFELHASASAAGPLLVAADLHLCRKAGHDEWRSLFEPSQLAASEVMDGAAIVATDFHPDAFGFVRLLVLDRRLMPARPGLGPPVARSRNLPHARLAGLPEAEAAGPVIRRIETELPLLWSGCGRGRLDRAANCSPI